MAIVEGKNEGLSLDSVFDAIDYVPHSGQELIHYSTARHRVASCGRRFGKSVVGGHELTAEALYAYTQKEILGNQGKRREFWIIGPEYSDAEKEFRVLYNDLTRLEVPFDKPGTYNHPESGDMVVSLWSGKYLAHAKSARYPSTLVGEGLAGVIMAEAAKLKQSVWTKYIRPTLADFKGWSLFCSTPEGKNWFYDMYRRGQDPASTSWDSWRMPSWINPIVFPDGINDNEIVEMRLDMSEEKFNQEVGADFTEFVGRVFKDFDEEIHVNDCVYDPTLPLFGCCDYGWTNPFVWLAIQVDTWDNVYVLGEYRVMRRDVNDIAEDLAHWPLAANARRFYPDPASPGDSAILEKRLRIPFDSATGGEKKFRIEYIREKLKLGPDHAPDELKQPKLFINRNCVGLIQEMQDYRYPDNKSEVRANPEEPMDKDDHGPEALGRFFRGYYGPPASSARQHAKVVKAKLGGGPPMRRFN